jgi:hypothetical protein
MPLFKSAQTRRIERDLEVKRGLSMIRRNIRGLHRHESDYLEKARRARRLGDGEQFDFLRRTLKRTSAQRRLLERQLLGLETAVQIKDQSESHAQFARSIEALASAIGRAFGTTDLARTQARFETALARARSIEERMSLFLDSATEILGEEDVDRSDVVSDEEIDALIGPEDEFEENDTTSEPAGLEAEIR